jgi:hypothetical protein
MLFRYILTGPDKVEVVVVGRAAYAKAFQELREKFPKGILRIRAEIADKWAGDSRS